MGGARWDRERCRPQRGGGFEGIVVYTSMMWGTLAPLVGCLPAARQKACRFARNRLAGFSLAKRPNASLCTNNSPHSACAVMKLAHVDRGTRWFSSQHHSISTLTSVEVLSVPSEHFLSVNAVANELLQCMMARYLRTFCLLA